MDQDSSMLVDYSLIETSTFYTSPYSRFEGKWAEPNISDAADMILTLSNDHASAKKIGLLGRDKYIDFVKSAKEHNVNLIERYF